MLKLLGILFLSIPPLAFAAAPKMVSTDPYLAPLGKPTHELKVRIFQHGLKNYDNLVAEQIQQAEKVLSQCPGVVVKITPVVYQKKGSSTAQEEIIVFKNTDMYFTKNFLKFLKPFAADRRQGPLDLHMTEYMNKEIRKTQKLNGQINYGQAYNPANLHLLFKDPRAVADQKPILEDIVGNSLVLAMGTVVLQRKTSLKYPQVESHPRSYSLLAHELGHLILDKHDPVTGYHDHWCPAFNDYCDQGYLMTGGGNNDAYYTDRTTGKIVGYDPLPKIDNIQCERLKTSPYLQRL